MSPLKAETFLSVLDRKIEEALLLSKHSVLGARQIFQGMLESKQLCQAKYSTVYWVARAKFEEVGALAYIALSALCKTMLLGQWQYRRIRKSV